MPDNPNIADASVGLFDRFWGHQRGEARTEVILHDMLKCLLFRWAYIPPLYLFDLMLSSTTPTDNNSMSSPEICLTTGQQVMNCVGVFVVIPGPPNLGWYAAAGILGC